MRRLIFSGKGVDLRTGKEISFHVPATMSHKGLETIMRNVRTREISVGGVSDNDPVFIGQAFSLALSSMRRRDALLDEYCGILARQLGELLMLRGFPPNAAWFEFERLIVDERISVRPKLCVNNEIVKTPEQIGRFMAMVREDLPKEFPEYYHPLADKKSASA